MTLMVVVMMDGVQVERHRQHGGRVVVEAGRTAANRCVLIGTGRALVLDGCSKCAYVCVIQSVFMNPPNCMVRTRATEQTARCCPAINYTRTQITRTRRQRAMLPTKWSALVFVRVVEHIFRFTPDDASIQTAPHADASPKHTSSARPACELSHTHTHLHSLHFALQTDTDIASIDRIRAHT